MPGCVNIDLEPDDLVGNHWQAGILGQSHGPTSAANNRTGPHMRFRDVDSSGTGLRQQVEFVRECRGIPQLRAIVGRFPKP